MERLSINSLSQYIQEVQNVDSQGHDIIIYRGQKKNFTLLPSIARNNPSFDSTKIEEDMLNELERRSPLLVRNVPRNRWEWLVFAQHFGLKTRLLDWTSNPLIALWFACEDYDKSEDPCFVYRLVATNKMLVDIEKNKTPFQNSNTRIHRPTLNNERIVAQSGWFTAHRFSRKANQFVALEENSSLKENLMEFEITWRLMNELRDTLGTLGVSNRTIFPDVVGLCNHLNYKNRVIIG